MGLYIVLSGVILFAVIVGIIVILQDRREKKDAHIN